MIFSRWEPGRCIRSHRLSTMLSWLEKSAFRWKGGRCRASRFSQSARERYIFWSAYSWMGKPPMPERWVRSSSAMGRGSGAARRIWPSRSVVMLPLQVMK